MSVTISTTNNTPFTAQTVYYILDTHVALHAFILPYNNYLALLSTVFQDRFSVEKTTLQRVKRREIAIKSIHYSVSNELSRDGSSTLLFTA